MNAISRRSVLKALGLTAGSLALPSVGRAAPAQPRLLIYTTSHGTVYDQWRLRPGGIGDDVDFEADLSGLTASPILTPLAGYATRLLVLDGLADLGALAAPVGPHDAGHVGCLTGRIATTSGGLALPDGPSLDQWLGALSTAPLRSLEYAVGGQAVCFDTFGNAVPYEDDVVAAYERLFPGETARLAARRGSVLDLVADRYDAMLGRVGSADRATIEQHRDLVRDLERQVETIVLTRNACGTPPAPDALPAASDAEYPAAAALAFFRIARVALSCRFTDIVSIRHDGVTNAAIGAPAGDLHNDYAHTASTDPVSATVMTAYHTFQAARFAALLDELDAVDEQSGSLLDNTIAVWNNELATGEHGVCGVPVVIAGGAGAFRMGRQVRWAPQHTVAGRTGDLAAGPPHNRLLVTLGRAMGARLDSFGETEFEAADGSVIDATGALDRV